LPPTLSAKRILRRGDVGGVLRRGDVGEILRREGVGDGVVFALVGAVFSLFLLDTLSAKRILRRGDVAAVTALSLLARFIGSRLSDFFSGGVDAGRLSGGVDAG